METTLIQAEVSAYDLPGDTKIERCQQKDGNHKWAVRCSELCMDRDGKFELEPMPSNRDDAFLSRCRFHSADEAYETWVLTQTANASLRRTALIKHTAAVLEEMRSQLKARDSEIEFLKLQLEAYMDDQFHECPNCKEVFVTKADGTVDAVIGA